MRIGKAFLYKSDIEKERRLLLQKTLTAQELEPHIIREALMIVVKAGNDHKSSLQALNLRKSMTT